MNNADVQEMLAIAILAKESGFPRIQADPADIIEVFEQRNQLLALMEEVFVIGNRLVSDVYGGEFKNKAIDAIARAKGESK